MILQLSVYIKCHCSQSLMTKIQTSDTQTSA